MNNLSFVRLSGASIKLHKGKSMVLLASLKGQCHVMDIFVVDLHILIGNFCVYADGFLSLKKAFHYQIQILTFYLLLWNYFSILKMLTEPSSEFPSLWLADVLLCRHLIGCRENAQEFTCHRWLLVWFYRLTGGFYNDKKENKIFLIYEENQMGSGAKSYLRKCFLVYEEMRKYFPIYEEAVSHIWLCTRSLLISSYERKFYFILYQCSKHFQCQNRRFRVFEAGLVLKVFLKIVKNFKGAS